MTASAAQEQLLTAWPVQIFLFTFTNMTSLQADFDIHNDCALH